VAQVRDLVHDAYRRLGALAPAAAPPPAVLLGDRGGLLGAFAQRWDDQARERALANLQNRDDLRPRDAVARFLLYVHQPPPEPLRDLEADPPDLAGVVDVHQAIASIGAYPALLRALGLVVDLTLPGPLPA